LISENYSRCLSIFRVFTQPGSKTEVSQVAWHVRFTLRGCESLGVVWGDGV
jgi:hypothetical protein